MLEIKAVNCDVPVEVLIAFPKALNDSSTREQIRKMWLCGNNREYAQLAFLKSRNNEMIFRPVSLKVDYIKGVLYLRTPSRMRLILPAIRLKDIAEDIEDILSALSDYVYVQATRRRKSIFIHKIRPLHGVTNVEKAREILETVDLTPLEILTIGMGYKWSKHVMRLMLPRFFAWLRGFDGRPIHVIQFTQPNSGKTTFGLRSETLFNFEYLNEVPTKARLIMDSRSGELGIVYLRDGIVFDEFDKWHISIVRVSQVYENLLTGMEQGKWVRGTTKAVAEAPDVRRWLPILFMGNLGEMAEFRQLRLDFVSTFSSMLNVDVSPLCDRVSLIDVCTQEIPVTEYVTNKVLPDSVIRGIVKVVQGNIKECDESSLKGRAKRHSNVILAALRALGFDPNPEDIDTLVAGNDTLDTLFRHIFKTKTKGVNV